MNVFRNNAAEPAEPQVGELELEAALTQRPQQRPLGEVRQSDLVEVEEGAEQGENQQPDREAKPSKADPTDASKPAFLARGHTQELGGTDR